MQKERTTGRAAAPKDDGGDLRVQASELDGQGSELDGQGNAGPEEGFQTGKVVMISLAHMVHDIYSSFLAPLLPLLIDKLGLSYGLAASLSVFQRLPSLLNPVVGALAERMSVRYFVIATPGVTAIVMSLIGAAPHYAVLVILLLIMGLSATLFHVPSPVMVKRVAGGKTGRGMSFYMLGGEFARSIGPLVILGAVSLWGLEGTWRLMPFGIAASVVLYFQFHRIRISDQFRARSEGLRIRATFGEHRRFLILVSGILFFQSLLKSALTAFLPTLMTGEGASVWTGGGYLSVLQLAGAAGTFMAGGISDRFGRKKTLIVSAALGPVLLWLFLSLDGAAAIVVLLLLGLAIFAPMPVMLALVQDQDAERPVFLNGLYMGLSFLLGAIGVQIVGATGDLIGLRETFSLTAFLSLFALPCIVLLRAKKTK
jgi:FSR family fosmidomycin resistance protein-like MFS transporter